MAKFLVMRPQGRPNRMFAFGHQVNPSLGKYGGFYVGTEREAAFICKRLVDRELGDWSYRPVEDTAKETAGFREYHKLQEEARQIMGLGGSHIPLNSGKQALLDYVKEHETLKVETAD